MESSAYSKTIIVVDLDEKQYKVKYTVKESDPKVGLEKYRNNHET